MLVSLAVALLSAAPGHVSLLASDAPALPAAARVLAQSDTLTPPPLPPHIPDADTLTPPPLPPRTPDEDDPTWDVPEAQVSGVPLTDLDRQVREVDLRIQRLDLRWPGYAVALTLTGIVLTSVSVTLLPLLLLSESLLLPIGTIGIAGLGLMVGGYAAGETALAPTREEHRRLRRERSKLKEELRLRREGHRETWDAPVATRPAVRVTLVSLTF